MDKSDELCRDERGKGKVSEEEGWKGAKKKVGVIMDEEAKGNSTRGAFELVQISEWCSPLREGLNEREVVVQEGSIHPSDGVHYSPNILRINEEHGLARFTNSETQLVKENMEAHLIPNPPLSKPINPQNPTLSNIGGEGCSSQQVACNDDMGLFTSLKKFDKEFARDTIAKLLENVMRGE